MRSLLHWCWSNFNQSRDFLLLFGLGELWSSHIKNRQCTWKLFIKYLSTTFSHQLGTFGLSYHNCMSVSWWKTHDNQSLNVENSWAFDFEDETSWTSWSWKEPGKVGAIVVTREVLPINLVWHPQKRQSYWKKTSPEVFLTATIGVLKKIWLSRLHSGERSDSMDSSSTHSDTDPESPLRAMPSTTMFPATTTTISEGRSSNGLGAPPSVLPVSCPPLMSSQLVGEYPMPGAFTHRPHLTLAPTSQQPHLLPMSPPVGAPATPPLQHLQDLAPYPSMPPSPIEHPHHLVQQQNHNSVMQHPHHHSQDEPLNLVSQIV